LILFHALPLFRVDPRYLKKTTTLPANLPYLIKRTHVGNLPVYCETRKSIDRRFGPVTVIGNVYGDISRFKEDLLIAVGGSVDVKIRKAILKGNREDKVKQWLSKLGF
jgi:hypothetical protein